MKKIGFHFIHTFKPSISLHSHKLSGNNFAVAHNRFYRSVNKILPVETIATKEQAFTKSDIVLPNLKINNLKRILKNIKQNKRKETLKNSIFKAAFKFYKIINRLFNSRKFLGLLKPMNLKRFYHRTRKKHRHFESVLLHLSKHYSKYRGIVNKNLIKPKQLNQNPKSVKTKFYISTQLLKAKKK